MAVLLIARILFNYVQTGINMSVLEKCYLYHQVFNLNAYSTYSDMHIHK